MKMESLPRYADFDDYRYNLRIAVYVRWFLLIAWFSQFNYRPDFENLTYIPNSLLALSLIFLNGYVHWRVWKGLLVTRQWALGLSILDVTTISLGLWVSGGFANNYFVLYYPAVAAFALVFTSSRLSFVGVTVVAIAYIVIGISVDEGVSFESKEEKVLFIRIVTMYAMVVVVNFIIRLERMRRLEAVEAERARNEENVELLRRAQEAERALQVERIRISEEIHNGAAQSAYVIGLGLEACRNLVTKGADELADKLKALHTVAKQAIWELRYPINLGPVFEGKDLARVLEAHVDNFKTITSLPTTISISGQQRTLPVLMTQHLFSVAHNAMTNAYRHAEASSVAVELSFENSTVCLSIADDGVGLSDIDMEKSPGHGLRNIKRIADELGGKATIDSKDDGGTIVTCCVPTESPAKDQVIAQNAEKREGAITL